MRPPKRDPPPSQLLLRVSAAFLTLVAVACQDAPVAPNPSLALSGTNSYVQTNLLSDGSVSGTTTDPNLVNGWGLVSSPTSPWWISDNGTGKTILYRVNTGVVSFFTVPGAGGQQSKPTGIVFNGGTGFVVNNGAGTSPARFILASEDGTISAFRGNPLVIVVDNSASGAIYKGLAIDDPLTGTLLYAANFHAGTVDVFDANFHPVTLPGGFVDPHLQKGFAPFGIQAIKIGGQTQIFVAYARPDAAAEDEIAGQGLGIVDRFGTDGSFLGRVATRGQLNAPWGMALAPADFGPFSGDLLVGNFGDGQISAYEMLADGSFEYVGQLKGADKKPILIDGLWGIAFGSGAPANGPTNALFFAAGPDDETHGLFGKIEAAP